jgi:Fe-S cluster biogenesis protein NfuA
VLRRDRAAERVRDVEERIRAALGDVRAMVHIDPASVELVRFVPATGLAVLRIEGRCPDCGLSATMLMQGIAAHVRSRVPEVRDVHNEIDGRPTDE